jgi:hypothetical protein
MSDTKADPTQDQGAEDQEETTQPDSGPDARGKDGGDQDANGESGDEDEAPSAEAYKKLQAKATRREDALRKAQARVKELEAKEKGDTPEDPEVVANRKLIRASGKTVLAGLGVTDRAAQASVLELINLSDIEVDSNGDPDEDEIIERIERLRDALGAGQRQERRTPQRNTADRGGSRGGNTDPTSARMQAFLRNR